MFANYVPAGAAVARSLMANNSRRGCGGRSPASFGGCNRRWERETRRTTRAREIARRRTGFVITIAKKGLFGTVWDTLKDVVDRGARECGGSLRFFGRSGIRDIGLKICRFVCIWFTYAL